MYELDLAAMIQLLQEFRQNVTLQTELRNINGMKGSFPVQIELFEGNLVACWIKSSTNQILYTNNEALQLLQSMGKLTWILNVHKGMSSSSSVFQEPQSRPIQPMLALPAPSRVLASPVKRIPIPRRTIQVSQGQINTWPRRHRMIYVLIDGKKNVQQIATILSLPNHIVERVLTDFQSIRIITWD